MNNYNKLVEKLKQQHQRNGWEINEQRIRQQAWMLNDRLMNESALNNANASSAAAGAGGSGNRRVVVVKNNQTSLLFFILNGTWQYMLVNYTTGDIGGIFDTGLNLSDNWIMYNQDSTYSVQYKGYGTTFSSNSLRVRKHLFINTVGEIVFSSQFYSLDVISNMSYRNNFLYVKYQDNSNNLTIYIFDGDNYKEYQFSNVNDIVNISATINKLILVFNSLDGNDYVYLLDTVNDANLVITLPNSGSSYLSNWYSDNYFIILTYDNSNNYTSLLLIDEMGVAIHNIDLTSSGYLNSYMYNYGGDGNFAIIFVDGSGNNFYYIFEGSELTQYNSNYEHVDGAFLSNKYLDYTYLSFNNNSSILLSGDVTYQNWVYKFPGEVVGTFSNTTIIGSPMINQKSIGYLYHDDINNNVMLSTITSGNVVTNVVVLVSDNGNSFDINPLYDRYLINYYTENPNIYHYTIYNYDGTFLDSINGASGIEDSGNSIIFDAGYCINSSMVNLVNLGYTLDNMVINTFNNGDVRDGSIIGINYTTGNCVHVTNNSINQFVINYNFSNVSQNNFRGTVNSFIIYFTDNNSNDNITLICDYNGNIIDTINSGSYDNNQLLIEDRVMVFYKDSSNNINYYLLINGVIKNYSYNIDNVDQHNTIFINDIRYNR